MSSRLLPRLVSVRKSVLKGSSFQGEVPSEALPSLCSAIEQCEAVVATINFSSGESGLPEVSVDVSAKVELVCQRCLDNVAYALKSKTTLTVVRDDEEAKRLLKELEPLLVDDDELDLYQLVEEELSLALPSVALHEGEERADCEARATSRMNGHASLGAEHLADVRQASEGRAGQVARGGAGDTYRPFEGLADILNQDRG